MKLDIALIGSRGVPASYGGFETCVEEVGSRLAEAGHRVTVYCRGSHYEERLASYRKMRLVYVPGLKGKSLETPSSVIAALVHASLRSYDVVMVFGITGGSMLLLPRLFGKKVAINTDGLEWERGKWGGVAKAFFKGSTWLATRFADRVVTDSMVLKDYFKRLYGIESDFIAYGADVEESSDPALLQGLGDGLGLTPGGYFLQITRFEPENNPLLTLRAFKRLKTDKKLVLVGGVKYPSDYTRLIEAEAGEDVVMPGFVFDKSLLRELWCNSYAYVHGNEAGGTNPALLQSMASGAPVIAIDVPFSREVLADAGLYFKKDINSLTDAMGYALDNPERLKEHSAMALERIREYYSWDKIAGEYEALFIRLARGKAP